jgi:hypothetical protein
MRAIETAEHAKSRRCVESAPNAGHCGASLCWMGVQRCSLLIIHTAFGGGVAAGIDFGLTLLAEIAGEDVAKSVQLGLEYDPQPPFQSGSPEKAGAERTAKVPTQMEKMIARRQEANAAAALLQKTG